MALGRPKLILSGLVGVVVIAGLMVGLTRGGDGDGPRLRDGGPTLEGTAAFPAISAPSLTTNGAIDVSAYTGKTVIINAWASWCGPCREEAPDILRFTKDHPDVVMLGLNMNDIRGNARDFNADVGWTHPSMFDPRGRVGFDTLKVLNLPATIYIDKNGIERGRTRGTVTYDDLASVAARLK